MQKLQRQRATWFPKSRPNILVYTLAIILTIAPFPAIPLDEPLQYLPEKNTLYLVLMAEMATTRGLKRDALKYYGMAASLSTDPAVAEQATLSAVNFEAPIEAIKNAKRWATLDSKNLQAQLVALTLLANQSTGEILPYLQQALNIAPIDLDQEVLEIQSQLTKSSAKNLKNAMIMLAKANPFNPQALLMAAQSAAEQNDVQNAKRWANAALEIKPELTRAIELKTKIIYYEEASSKNALNYLKNAVELYPKDAELRLFYANFLFENDAVTESIHALNQILSNPELGGVAALFLGEIYLKQENIENASKALHLALSFANSKAGAEYLLGEIAEQNNKPAEAIQWYSHISKGPYHMPATLRAAFLLKKAKAYPEAIQLVQNSHPTNIEEEKYLLCLEIELLNANKQSDEAYALVNELVSKLPNDADMLYSRAITAIKLKQLSLAEKDLLHVVAQNPEHANALNALGYVLSFQTERLNESLEYVNQALKLSPNNPTFVDSLGWIYYQKGDWNEAIYYLKLAHDLGHDTQIAAHLGEVLWVNNQQQEALTIWEQALSADQDDEILLETLQRFKIKLTAR
jgi:tetratricopeptide (TPR) repeat protein